MKFHMGSVVAAMVLYWCLIVDGVVSARRKTQTETARPIDVIRPHRQRYTSHRVMNKSAEDMLLRELLYDYERDARGVTDSSQTIHVTITFVLLRIQGLDERSQILTTTGLLITDWHDDRLTWTPSDYSNLSDVVLQSHRIWLPELALMNGADVLAHDFKKIRVLVSHTGHVHWEPGGIFSTSCDIDIRYFPFDEQSCPIMIGAWAYYSARMNLTNATSSVQTQQFGMNGEWNVFKTKAEWQEIHFECCPDRRYPYVTFTLYLKRRHTFYIMNIIVPCTLLSVLVMIVFCLPPDAGEKISLGISVLLAFSVFLLMVAENVPRTSLDVPIIVIYLTTTMVLGTASVCMTVLVLNLHFWNPERPIPSWVRVFVLDYLAKFLCIRMRHTPRERVWLVPSDQTLSLNGLPVNSSDTSSMKPMLHHQSTVTSDSRPTSAAIDNNKNMDLPRNGTDKDGNTSCVNQWKNLAQVLDRFFFILVLLSMTASTLIIMLVPEYKENKYS